MPPRPRLDYDEVMPRIHQGGALDPSRSYRPFSMIVLCAAEEQPQLPRFAGKVLRPAFIDSSAERDADAIFRAAHQASREVAREWINGGNILVTCQMGWNRSGLVVGLSMNRITAVSPDRIVAAIRRARGKDALCNLRFEAMIFANNQARARIAELRGGRHA